jgi:hypothetical protein
MWTINAMKIELIQSSEMTELDPAFAGTDNGFGNSVGNPRVWARIRE